MLALCNFSNLRVPVATNSTARLAKRVNGDDLALAEQGLAEWVSALEEEEKERS
jgi:hypothetical protein